MYKKGSGGKTCSNEGSTAGCSPKTCLPYMVGDKFYSSKCVLGNESDSACEDNADCRVLKVCGGEGKCVPLSRPGEIVKAKPCLLDNECLEKTCHRDSSGNVTCVFGGNSQRKCSTVADCEGYYCDSNGTCKQKGDTFLACRPYVTKCMHETCYGKECVTKLTPGIDYCGSGANPRDCTPSTPLGPFPVDPAGPMLSLSGSRAAPDDNSIPEEPQISPAEALPILAALNKAPQLGTSQAPLTIYMFQDFSCGMCKYAYHEIIKRLLKDYVAKGKASLTFVEFPLGEGAEAVRIAEAALCAGEQGAYSAYAKRLYRKTKKSTHEVDDPLLLNNARKLQLNLAQFSQCLADHKYRQEISREVQAGKQLGVRGTPHFFINGQSSPGARSYSLFRSLIEQIMSQTGDMPRK